MSSQNKTKKAHTNYLLFGVHSESLQPILGMEARNKMDLKIPAKVIIERSQDGRPYEEQKVDIFAQGRIQTLPQHKRHVPRGFTCNELAKITK